MSSPNYVDFSQVYKRLEKSGKKADLIVSKAVNTAGEKAMNELKQNTPRFNGTKYSRDGQDYKKEHMRDHVVMSKANKNNHVAEVGFDDDVAWMAHFPELGTIKQRPQGFIQKTINSIESEVASIIQKALQEAFLK